MPTGPDVPADGAALRGGGRRARRRRHRRRRRRVDERRRDRRPRRAAPTSRASSARGSTSTARTGWRRCCCPELRDRFDGIERADSSSSTRTSGCSRRPARARWSTASPALARAVHTQHGPYIDVLRTRRRRVQPVRPRATSSPAGRAGCRSGSRSRCTASTRIARRSAAASSWRSAMADALDACPRDRAGDAARARRRAVPPRRLGARRVARVGATAARRRRRLRRADDVPRRGRRSAGVHAPAHTGRRSSTS